MWLRHSGIGTDKILVVFLESAHFQTQDEGWKMILVHISVEVNRHYL
jgi:hypothetical protein